MANSRQLRRLLIASRISPDRVAADIERAIARGRRVVYTPWFWRPIMTVIRLLPWFLFRRLKV